MKEIFQTAIDRGCQWEHPHDIATVLRELADEQDALADAWGDEDE